MFKIFQSKTTLEAIVLIFILLIGAAGFLSFAHQPKNQLVIVVLTGSAYVVWGCWHHLRQGEFYWQVFLEYLLIAALVVVLTASLLI